MATTDGKVARKALDALSASGIRFAVLHKEAMIAAGSVPGDVDIVVERPPSEIVSSALTALHQSDLHPIILWPYDVAATATVFLAEADAHDATQIDMLCDDKGKGKYGLRSAVLLSDSVAGNRWQRIAPEHELLYLLRKRSLKGNQDEVLRLRHQAEQVGIERVVPQIDRVFSRYAAASVSSILAGGHASLRTVDRSPSAMKGELLRKARRLVRPVGFWAECVGHQNAGALASAMAERFGRFLPYANAGPRPSSLAGQTDWWFRTVASTRWRPGLFVSWALRQSRFPQEDLTLDADLDSDSACRRLVAAMESRLVQ